MGKRYTKLYMESVLEGKPRFWIAPPANILAADFGDTLVNGILAGTGAWMLSGGISYLTTGRVDMAACASWSAITAGLVIGLPIAGDTLAEVMGDVAQAVAEGWNRGQPEPEAKPEPEPAPMPEPTEDEAGAAPIEGEYWYHSRSGRLCCYPTPRDKNHRPQISDARMQTIFRLALDGTPFSEREMTDKVSGLSGPRFRILKQDWRSRALYTMNPDKTGHFTVMGQIVAEAIANHPPAPH